MPIGITDEHEELHQVARRWVEAYCPPAVPRVLLDAEAEERPPFWEALAGPGWLGLHVSEEHGGIGYGFPELVVVLEELGRAVAPGPFVPTVWCAAVLDGGDGGAAAKALLPGLATGTTVGTVAFDSGVLAGEETADGLRVTGTLRPVLSAHLADVVLAPVTVGGTTRWYALDTAVAGVEVRELPSLDLTRRLAEVVVDGAIVPGERLLANVTDDAVREVAAVLFAAELVGVAQWCVETASEYAKVRVQFGRPIGQFQAVKHKCADMLGRLELARAATWDAARAHGHGEEAPLVAAIAAALALEAAFTNAKECVQILGGIGFTWEHDAHLFLRRATALRQLLGGAGAWRRRAARLALGGVRRRLTVDLPEEAEAYRADVRAFLDEVNELDPLTQRRRMADDGYIVPDWPKPWGRDATALEQLVIQDEFRVAKVPRPGITVGQWALPNLIVYGTEEQQQRWIPPTLRGEIEWCQLFSEPGAGSDLASLSTRAERVEGGWVVNGQKVWTSLADDADWGILLARTHPEAPKHEGISCFMVDMKHSPGIEVRPLRELTGAAMFNEVFFTDVFVPDDCLVGDEHDGWRCARTTLANERVYMGSGQTIGLGVEGCLGLLRAQGRTEEPHALDVVGALVTEAHALAVLGFRLTLSALRGVDPSGSEASVKKLLGVQHDQRMQEVGLALLGPEGAVAEGEAAIWSSGFLFNRCLTIAGGTSEIQRNIVAERVLGLPRDP